MGRLVRVFSETRFLMPPITVLLFEDMEDDLRKGNWEFLDSNGNILEYRLYVVELPTTMPLRNRMQGQFFWHSDREGWA
jgi:hypothetical protein